MLKNIKHSVKINNFIPCTFSDIILCGRLAPNTCVPSNTLVNIPYPYREAEKASKNDHYYLFLKRLCQILVEMGKQLCLLWVRLSYNVIFYKNINLYQYMFYIKIWGILFHLSNAKGGWSSEISSQQRSRTACVSQSSENSLTCCQVCPTIFNFPYIEYKYLYTDFSKLQMDSIKLFSNVGNIYAIFLAHKSD